MKSGLFTLVWIRHDGCATEIHYSYDGQGSQAGYSRHGWIMRCIAFGKTQGLRYHGMKKGTGV
jgi:hypothetical protein